MSWELKRILSGLWLGGVTTSIAPDQHVRLCRPVHQNRAIPAPLQKGLSLVSKDTINGIPRVDPNARTASQRAWAPIHVLSDAKPFAAMWRRIGAPLDPWVIKATRGRMRLSNGAPVLVLTTTGARSGQQRERALAYFTDGDDVILMASNYGGAQHPAWYHNLLAHPACELHIGPSGGRFVAREAEGDDRDRLFALAIGLLPASRKYAQRTEGIRTIRMLRLAPDAVPVKP
jgi:deazaflavin-dependent oxidoreductase (nitroreductase family)